MTELCVVPSPPEGRPLIWARQGSDHLWHPANLDGTLRCAWMHGVTPLPEEPTAPMWRVVPADDAPRRWAVTVPGRDRCSYRPWPGPADGVGPVPERVPPVPLAGAAATVREMWMTLLGVQGHRCAVCLGVPTVIDHGPDLMVRALLCRMCRRILNDCTHNPRCFAEYRNKPPARVFAWHLAGPIRQGAS